MSPSYRDPRLVGSEPVGNLARPPVSLVRARTDHPPTGPATGQSLDDLDKGHRWRVPRARRTVEGSDREVRGCIDTWWSPITRFRGRTSRRSWRSWPHTVR